MACARATHVRSAAVLMLTLAPVLLPDPTSDLRPSSTDIAAFRLPDRGSPRTKEKRERGDYQDRESRIHSGDADADDLVLL